MTLTDALALTILQRTEATELLSSEENLVAAVYGLDAEGADSDAEAALRYAASFLLDAADSLATGAFADTDLTAAHDADRSPAE